MSLAPENVWPEAMAKLPAGAVLTNAIVLLEYVVPGEDDHMERGPMLAYWRSTEQGAVWHQIGMLQVMTDTLRRDCGESFNPNDEG